MTIQERVERARRDQFYGMTEALIKEGIPVFIQIGGLLACAWVLCGMCAG